MQFIHNSKYRVIEASDPIISIESTQNKAFRMRGGGLKVSRLNSAPLPKDIRF